jgi:hypothetical protein
MIDGSWPLACATLLDNPSNLILLCDSGPISAHRDALGVGRVSLVETGTRLIGGESEANYKIMLSAPCETPL